MKIMFNGLDRPFELSNSRYRREARKVLCFAKHHSLTHIYIYIEREREREMAYGALQSKKPLLLRGEISYPEVSNDQFKLLNNFFISKSYKILNFMFF
jgi:hypothetical protein